MGDLRFLFEFVLTVAALTIPAVVGIGLLGDGESAEMSWPPGIQEEEPKRWNVYLVNRKSGPTRPADADRDRVPRHPLPLSR